MAKHVVAKASELADGDRLIVTLQGRSIGIFRIGERFYAFLNRCPHKGAELCRGSVLGHLEADLPGQVRWSASQPMLQCPWHGWEYDMETGQSYFDSSIRPYPVGVEPGDEVDGELEAGDAVAADPAAATAASGRNGAVLRPGPFKADTFPVTLEDDYLVVTLPGRARPARESTPAQGTAG